MSRERQSRRHRGRPPVSYHQSDDDDDDDDPHDTDYDPHDDDDPHDTDYDPHDDDDPHDTDDDPHDDEDYDDEDYELPNLERKQLQQLTAQARYRARHPDRVAASQQRFLAKRQSKVLRMRAKCKRYRAKNPDSRKKYRENNREFIAVSNQCYREKRSKQVAWACKRYRARYPERVAEAHKRYRENHRARVAEAQRRYREKHRAQLAKAQKRYRENNPERRLAYDQQYRETHRDLLREKERCRRARLVEKKRTREKMEALGPLALTIPLTDCLKSIPVTLESVDTNGPPTDSHTLLDLDSGTMQVADSPDWDDLSFLQDLLKDMSPDDWQQVMNDVEDFDVEALLPPEDLVHGMSSDEGVDLMYDLVS